MNWDERVVDASTKEAARILSGCLDEEAYLAGGTGTALQLGHRVSLDLDLFFPTNRLGEAERDRILDALRSKGTLEVLLSQDRTCHLRLEEVAISLFHYSYPLVREPAGIWRGLRVASLSDIAAMKLNAVSGRGAKKDFIDVYFIAQRIGLAKILQFAGEKFKDHPSFIPQVCKALLYFDDAEKEPMPRMKARTKWVRIRNYFEIETPKLMRKILK